MEENIKEILLMIKRKVMEYIIGVMVVNMKVNGRMINNMEREFILIKNKKELKVFG
jgi:hypothetical protein